MTLKGNLGDRYHQVGRYEQEGGMETEISRWLLRHSPHTDLRAFWILSDVMCVKQNFQKDYDSLVFSLAPI